MVVSSLGHRRIYHWLVGVSIFTATIAAQETTFRSTVPLVVVPVTVTDSRGRYIEGLQAEDFQLLDNGTPREIRLDMPEATYAPLALVVAVQANDLSATAVLKIRKTGSMIQPLITGERGHAAVITYGEKVRVSQDFTSDASKIEAAFEGIRPEGSKARAIDAMARACDILGKRPKGERRIVLLIGESKDRGSETKLGDVLLDVQRLGITVFAAGYSAWITPFTTKASELPRTGAGGTDLLAALSELARLGKTSTSDALARESGGRVLSFKTLHGLEELLTRVGEEVHSQYVLSAAAMTEPEGFHTIQVIVRSRAGLVVHARQGYWAIR
jgi:VWFA-related protein